MYEPSKPVAREFVSPSQRKVLSENDESNRRKPSQRRRLREEPSDIVPESVYDFGRHLRDYGVWDLAYWEDFCLQVQITAGVLPYKDEAMFVPMPRDAGAYWCGFFSVSLGGDESLAEEMFNGFFGRVLTGELYNSMQQGISSNRFNEAKKPKRRGLRAVTESGMEASAWADLVTGSGQSTIFDYIPVGGRFKFRETDSVTFTKQSNGGWYTDDVTGARYKTGKNTACIQLESKKSKRNLKEYEYESEPFDGQHEVCALCGQDIEYDEDGDVWRDRGSSTNCGVYMGTDEYGERNWVHPPPGTEHSPYDDYLESKKSKRSLKETGEWSGDEEDRAWMDALQAAVLGISAEVPEFQFLSVHGFDKYQGPYARVSWRGATYNVWTLGDYDGDDRLWIEDFPVDNTSYGGNLPGFSGTWDEIADMLLSLSESKKRKRK